jgi:hypothetical protein
MGFIKFSTVKAMLYRRSGLKELVSVICKFIIFFECSSVIELHIFSELNMS